LKKRSDSPVALPTAFLERMRSLVNDQFREFCDSYLVEEPSSIRVHPQKGAHSEFKGERVAWEPLALTLAERPVFALDPAWHAGAYYVQESSSMLAGYVFRQYVKQAVPMRILDLCAAPGGKSTHILSEMGSDSLLVSNELIQKRNNILVENIQRWGFPNVVVTKNEAQDFGALGQFFDCILVDAPCSGEGLFRKQPEATREWSELAVEQCALRQGDILRQVAPALRPGGYLVYSTCTFEPSENEEQVEKLLRTGIFELIHLDATLLPGISEGFMPGTLRCWPHQTSGSGFFIALLRKTAHIDSKADHRQRPFWNWKPASKEGLKLSEIFIHSAATEQLLQSGDYLRLFPGKHLSDLQTLANALSIRHFGVDVGELKKGIFQPAHSLSYSSYLHPDIPRYGVNEAEALTFLRKQSLEPRHFSKGWAMLQYKGLHLGWIKHLGQRINNYLPQDKMLRMQ
jgi:16S rRNA C967 or C1407 C5-methylase (RsmB/RsmF family)/NOL1/NOP2/fmu family ribosome biogenesis protein